MNFFIHQSIWIQHMEVGAVANSSVLQIGSAGKIQSLATLANTGKFTKPGAESKTIIPLLKNKYAD